MFPWSDETPILNFSFSISKSRKQLIYYTFQYFLLPCPRHQTYALNVSGLWEHVHGLDGLEFVA